MNMRKKIYFEGIDLTFHADRNRDNKKTVSEPVSSIEQKNEPLRPVENISSCANKAHKTV
jgi:hypothetical protein